ncbi:uncharacterized protein VP01_1875g7 [Puccinia sorghi]|uniref:tRNA-splicing endonuclease subunit Sen15 domain-containing protein n=1 Tax=Puccinia sorghi TaxID=27349 RepID=A0A0L6VDQ4_9BASI|nr:uncharacterized protein VP01_1875g7 [Puccinia sorghi]
MSTTDGTLHEALSAVGRGSSQAGALVHAWRDLSAAQRWTHLVAGTVGGPEDAVRQATITGRPPDSTVARVVYPMALNQPTTFETLYHLLRALDLPKGATLLLAIVGNDSSIVYYDLAQGIVSPKEVPE